MNFRKWINIYVYLIWARKSVFRWFNLCNFCVYFFNLLFRKFLKICILFFLRSFFQSRFFFCVVGKLQILFYLFINFLVPKWSLRSPLYCPLSRTLLRPSCWRPTRRSLDRRRTVNNLLALLIWRSYKLSLREYLRIFFSISHAR